MSNEWFSKWHEINQPDKVVEVDTFFGRKFHLGGIVFQGQTQQLYWQSVRKYLTDQVHAIFTRWDVDTKSYPGELRRSSLEGTANTLRRFVTRVINQATDTDQRLRGRGFPKNVQPYNSSAHHSHANVEIERLKKSHMELIPGSKALNIIARIEKFLTSWPGIIGAAIGIAALILGIFAL